MSDKIGLKERAEKAGDPGTSLLAVSSFEVGTLSSSDKELLLRVIDSAIRCEVVRQKEQQALIHARKKLETLFERKDL